MKAVQITGYGDIDKLELVEFAIPELKANQVLVKVKACAINNTEIWMREGAYGKDSKSGWRPEGVHFPRTPGSDIAGQIVKVGKDVDTSMTSLGDRHHLGTAPIWCLSPFKLNKTNF